MFKSDTEDVKNCRVEFLSMLETYIFGMNVCLFIEENVTILNLLALRVFIDDVYFNILVFYQN